MALQRGCQAVDVALAGTVPGHGFPQKLFLHLVEYSLIGPLSFGPSALGNTTRCPPCTFRMSPSAPNRTFASGATFAIDTTITTGNSCGNPIGNQRSQRSTLAA